MLLSGFQTIDSPAVKAEDWSQSSQAEFENGTLNNVDTVTDPGNVTLSQQWTKAPANPVLDIGPPESWDDAHVSTPTIIYDGDTYRMWYSGHDGSTNRIGYATSSDGYKWSKYASNPVLDLGTGVSWDDISVFSPTVLFNGITFMMWYTGDGPDGLRIGHATSPDGIIWTKNANNPVLINGSSGSWDDTLIGYPTVLYNGTTYKMWYGGYNGTNWRIGYATSSDGVTWIKNGSNPVLDLGPSTSWDEIDVTDPIVTYDGSIYRMWYSGYDGTNWRIGYATSPDGIKWVKSAGNPVLDLGPGGSWDNFYLYEATVVYHGTTYKMWYSGHDGSNTRIGYAESAFGSSWTKYDTNMVLERGAYGAWDNTHVYGSAVIKKGNAYEMWYSGNNGTNDVIGFSKSSDGMNWMKLSGNPVLTLGVSNAWDNFSIYAPSVIYNGTGYQMWYGGRNTTNTSYHIGYATSANGLNWTKNISNPVLKPGPPGSWDSEHVSHPTVLFNGTSYQMWYTGGNVSGDRIGYATSPDGFNWTKHGNNPVFKNGSAGEWDDGNVYAPTVQFNGSMFRMWYVGFDGGITRIGLANSTDGTNWTRYSGNPVCGLGSPGSWDDNELNSPTVIYDSNVYKMWYSGHDGALWRTGYATSLDGENWTKANPVVDLGPGGSWDDNDIFRPSVIHNGTDYQMWYSANDGATPKIGYATSPDGITWMKNGSNPVLDVGPAPWDSAAVCYPFVIYNGTGYQMWYGGSNGLTFQIGYANSTDGVTWTKNTSNPVLSNGSAGSWDASHIYSPSVIFNGSMYKMWYMGSDGVNARIGYATSTNGTYWTKHTANPVLDLGNPGSWDDTHVMGPYVLYIGNTYYMFYSGNDNSNTRTGLATSKDGINWTKCRANPLLEPGAGGSWDSLHAMEVAVLYDGSNFKMWYTGHNGLNSRLGYASLTNGTHWWKLAVNPVIDLGPGGSYDDFYIESPSVIHNGKIYQMWYASHDGSKVTVSYATSRDGLTWKKYSKNPVLDIGPLNSWDDTHVDAPTVIYDGSQYKMWYVGDDGTTTRIGYANSTDGITWTKNSSNPVLDIGSAGAWDSDYIHHPTVLYNGTTYQMWYAGYNGTSTRIGYATSHNETNWTKNANNPVLKNGSSGSWDDAHVSTPTVIYEDSKYKMWYTGYSDALNRVIGYAISSDGTNWTKLVGNPVLGFGPAGSWDDTYTFGPTVLEKDMTKKMWYSGHDGATWRIGYAEMEYQPTGNLTSSVFDSGLNGTTWKTINWTESLPPGTIIFLSTRTGHTPTPDGSWSSWSTGISDETGSPIFSPKGRYIQYRATLMTLNTSVTPKISYLNINYSLNAAQEPILAAPPDNSWTNDNTPALTWTFMDPDLDTQKGYTVQISYLPTFSEINYTSGNVTSTSSSWTAPTLSDGKWYWRVRTQDIWGLWGDYSSYRIINIDTIAPGAPTGVSAKPPSWTNVNLFEVNWTNPADDSGIGAAYYRLDSAPTFNTDGTYSTSKPLTSISVPSDGSHTVYVWLVDNAGNINFNNYGTTIVYYDSDVAAPMELTATPSSWTNENLYSVDWTNPSDNTGIQTGAYYRIGTFPTYDTDGTWTDSKPITGLSVQGDGAHTIYIWLKDDLGNINHVNYGTTTLYYDTMISAPTELTATPNSWTNVNKFSVDWTNPTDNSGIITGAYYKLDSPPTSDTDGTWVATKPITNISVTGDGVHTLYIWVKDAAGNTNFTKNISTSLYYDTKVDAPTEITVSPENWTSINSFTIDWMNPSDNSGILTGAYYKFDSPPTSNSDGKWFGSKPMNGLKLPSEGEHKIYIWLKDSVGNVDYTKNNYTTLYLDSGMPVANKPSGHGAFNNTGTINWSWAPATDTVSDIAGYFMCIGTTPGGIDIFNDKWVTDNWYVHSNLMDGNTYYCKVKAKNNAGTTGIYGGNSAGVLVDTVPPTVKTITINDGAEYTTVTNFDLALSATDQISGIHQMAFSTDGSNWSDWEAYSKTKTFTFTGGDGTITIYFRVSDHAGNIGSIITDSIVLDTQPPHTLSITINQGAAWTGSTTVTLGLGAVDDTSGLNEMAFSPDGVTYGDWLAFKSTHSFVLPSGTGKKTVYFKVKDKAGNIADPVSAEIYLNESAAVIDSDGDGYGDDVDDFPDDPSEWLDTDGDGKGNNADPDDDNDGLTDNEEKTLGTDPLLKDTDKDGHDDGDDAYPTDSTKWKEEKAKEELNTELVAGLIGIIIVVIILAAVAAALARRKGKKGEGEVPAEEEKPEPIIPPEVPGRPSVEDLYKEDLSPQPVPVPQPVVQEPERPKPVPVPQPVEEPETPQEPQELQEPEESEEPQPLEGLLIPEESQESEEPEEPQEPEESEESEEPEEP
ncbi:MAG: hypothetical protein JSV49_05840 [Thermoplasmata archaeon]|nr:MAG: hypothetical protein JSV49_05840 [Thermoplasmata archaeon]